MPGLYCAVEGCIAKKSEDPDITFHRFPKDPQRAWTWAVAAGRRDLLDKVGTLHDTHRICRMHFDTSCFIGGNRLRLNANPTVFPSLEGSSSVDHAYSKDPMRLKDSFNMEEVDSSDEIQPPATLPDTIAIASDTSPSSPLSSPTCGTQTPEKFTFHSPRKAKLRQTIKETKNENYRLNKKIELMEQQHNQSSNLDMISLEDYKKLSYKFCSSPQLADFINVQVSQSQKKARGRRYSSEMKEQCLEMYFSGPKLYKNKLMYLFSLPAPRTLARYIEDIKIKPSLNEMILQMLSTKVQNFSELDKYVIVSIDEMAIKSHLLYNRGSDDVVGFEDYGDGEKSFKAATSATVIMVRGLFNNWKQPLCYFLHHSSCPAEKLQAILKDAIRALEKCSLNVCAIVSDLGSNNWKLAKNLNVSPETPFITIDEKQIIYIFDPPHLIKLLRNNLLLNHFLFDGKKTSWEYIKKFFEHNCQYSTRVAPKLTPAHINPNPFQKMKVKLATQVLSATVSASLNLYIRFGYLPAAAVGTSEVIEMFNNLFDIFNSSTNPDAGYYKKVFKNLDYQKEYLDKCDNFFKNVTVCDKKNKNITNKVKCLEGWRISIHGLKLLWEKVHSAGFEYLQTRRVSQDTLENFFGSVRQQSGNCLNPTSFQFMMAFRKLLCADLLNSGAENCEGDTDQILLRPSDALPNEQEDNVRGIELDLDYHHIDILQENATRYVCGYYIKKCLQKHSCCICETFAKDVKELDDSAWYCYFRAYKNKALDTFGNLQMPNNSFLKYILALENLFEQNFENVSIKKNVVKNLIIIFSQVNFSHPCKYFPHDYFLALYSRVRLYYTIKFTNHNFKLQRNVNDKSRKNKLVIWRHQ